MNQVLLNGFSLEELLQKIEQLIDKKIKQPIQKELKRAAYLSRLEVSQILKISLPTLNEWTKLGWLQSYRIGNRVLYKQDELELSLQKVTNKKYKKGL